MSEAGVAAVGNAAAAGGVRLAGRLLVCAAPSQLPPLGTGGGQVLSRLLREIRLTDYVLCSFGATPGHLPTLDPLPATTHRLPSAWSRPSRDSRYPLAGVRAIRQFASEGVRRGRTLAQLVRDEGCSALLVLTSASPDMAAALVAARLAGIPLIVYLLDPLRDMIEWVHPQMRFFSSWLEQHAISRAAAVLAISPVLGEEVERRYGMRVDVVNHSLPEGVSLGAPPAERPWPSQPGALSIVFTGGVYEANTDALASVARALDEPGLESATLHLYTAAKEKRLAERGLHGRVVVHQLVGIAKLIEIQRRADILLLPLGFATPYPHIVRTAWPTKSAEYLISGRPILIVAPGDSYAATMARRDGVAALVDDPRPAAIAAAIRRIAGDEYYRRGLVDAAWRAALRHHSPDVTTRRFRAVVDAVLADGRMPLGANERG